MIDIHRIENRPYLFYVEAIENGNIVARCYHRHWSISQAYACAKKIIRELKLDESETIIAWQRQ